MLAAVLSDAVDGRRPGRPMPTGVASPSPLDLASRRTSRAIEAMTASGVDGFGVATRSRSERSRPGFDIDDRRLDPAAADIDADGDPAAGHLGRLLRHRSLRAQK